MHKSVVLPKCEDLMYVVFECEQSEHFDVCQYLITSIPFSPASILVFCLSYGYFWHLKPETKSESLQQQNQQNLHPSSWGRKWGRRKGGNGSLVQNRFCCCPSFCEGRDQTESGPQAPRRAALGKEPPGKFSHSPRLPMGSEPGAWVPGNPSSRAQRLAAASPAWQKMTAAFLLRALIPWQGWRSSTPGRGVRGTRQSPAPRPVPCAARAARRAGGRPGLFGGSSSSAAGPRLPPGHIRAPAARGGHCGIRQLFSVPLPATGLGGHGGVGVRPLHRAGDCRAMPTGPAAGRGLEKAGSTLTEEGLGRPRCWKGFYGAVKVRLGSELRGCSYLFMEETLGTVSLSQMPSANSLSRISQANIVGFCLLYSAILSTTLGVATLGLEPPITPGLMLPVS